MRPSPSGVRGWLLVLCLLLTVWEPLTLAWLISSRLGALLYGDLATVAMMTLRMLVTALGLAAGLSLWTIQPHAVTLAKASLALSTVASVAIYTIPFFPTNWPPSDLPFIVALVAAYNGIWFSYLTLSARVRLTYAGKAPPQSGARDGPR